MTLIHTLKGKWLYRGIFFFISFISFSQNEVSLIFVGDIMQHDAQIEAAYNPVTKTYEYDQGFQFIRPLIGKYDFRVANLEVTLAGKPYKGYPQFSAPDELAKTLKRTGFNVVLTANNHACDRGDKGVLRTLDVLDKIGLPHTGTFRSLEERDTVYPLIIEKNGIQVAFLNYTYGTNGLSVNPPLIVNYIDTALIRKDIAEAKKRKADYVICNLHWGKEYLSLPDAYQKRIEKFCYKAGADMVIGGHPHTVQPVQVKTNDSDEKQLTVWSLGNFVSNMRTRNTRGGLMVGATIEKKGTKTSLKEAHHYLIYTLKKDEGAVTQYYILPDFDYNNYRPGFVDKVNEERMKFFIGDSQKLLDSHNIECEEKKVEEDVWLNGIYERMLTQYYAVWLPDLKEDVMLNHPSGNLLHCFVDEKGDKYILSGYFGTLYEAEVMRKVIKYSAFSDKEPKVVIVTPSKVTPIKQEEDEN